MQQVWCAPSALSERCRRRAPQADSEVRVALGNMLGDPQLGPEKPDPPQACITGFPPQIVIEPVVPGGLTWQRKWRDVLHAHTALADVYQGGPLNSDDFTRRIEIFFKTCRELADWIDEQQPGLNAKDYVNTAGSLKICNGLAQTAKHHTRNHGITAYVAKMYNDQTGTHADVAWTHGSSSGRLDARKLADDCIAEWQAFFQQHGLDTAS